jgi:phosphopantothenoylcysteine decarboxylase/phosphopantothenate--cysteine ligase
LLEKKCDFIILNSVNKADSGFASEKNTITILSKDGSVKEFPAMNKYDCALEIFNSL